MTLPGTTITEREVSPPRAPAVNTGRVFVAGLTEKGPTDRAVVLTSTTHYRRVFGGPTSFSITAEDVETAFREGASEVAVSRVVGPAAVKSSVVLKDAANADALGVEARNPGPDGDSYRAAVEAVAPGVAVVVYDSTGAVIERTPGLTTNADLAAFADTYFTTVRLVPKAGAIVKVVGQTPLTGGTDDRASVTDAHKVAALARFDQDFGPGQVRIPGATSIAAHQGIAEHCRADGRRVGLVDLPDADKATIKTAAALIRALPDNLARRLATFSTWAILPPAVVNGPTRRVPWGAVVAGHIAQVDALGNQNLAAAGTRGVASSWVIGVSRTFEADREELNDAGINVVRAMRGGLRTYGFRTVADPLTSPLHWQLANVRLDAAVAAKAQVILDDFNFDQVDGARVALSHFGGQFVPMLADYYRRGALFGATAEEAYTVDIGPSVNTRQTIAEGRARVVISICRAPMAERVELEVVKTPVA